MKWPALAILCTLACEVSALDYEQQFENERVIIGRAKIKGKEEINSHRDAYPQVVVAIKGGTVTRFEADGTTVDVDFPTGVAVYREADPENQYHKTVNKSSDPLDLLIIKLKDDYTQNTDNQQNNDTAENKEPGPVSDMPD